MLNRHEMGCKPCTFILALNVHGLQLAVICGATRNLLMRNGIHQFKEISLAYEILSDEEKKRTYDRHGEEYLKQGGPSHAGPSDLFSHLFGMGGGRARQRKGEDLVFPLKVTLEDLYNGKTTKVALKKKVICDECSGYCSFPPSFTFFIFIKKYFNL